MPRTTSKSLISMAIRSAGNSCPPIRTLLSLTTLSETNGSLARRETLIRPPNGWVSGSPLLSYGLAPNFSTLSIDLLGSLGTSRVAAEVAETAAADESL